MIKWFVRVPIYADAIFEIEADSEDAAIKQAVQKHVPSLCHHCAKQIELGEADVSADITAEEQ